MAILALAESRDDLRARLGRIVVGAELRRQGPVTAADLGAVGPMMALLNDALMPNLVQTGEGAPAIVHCGPFANIAHGTSERGRACGSACTWPTGRSTSAGFGFDLGGEKFFDLVARGGRYHCASSKIWDYRALRHGRNSIHRTAGYVTRTSGGVGGGGREAFSYPD
jgi:formyltetrahydrofolate synthetase